MEFGMLLALPLMLLAGTFLDVATNDDSDAPAADADTADRTVTDDAPDQDPII